MIEERRSRVLILLPPLLLPSKVLPLALSPATGSSPGQPRQGTVTGLLECRKRDETKLIKNLITGGTEPPFLSWLLSSVFPGNEMIFFGLFHPSPSPIPLKTASPNNQNVQRLLESSLKKYSSKVFGRIVRTVGRELFNVAEPSAVNQRDLLPVLQTSAATWPCPCQLVCPPSCSSCASVTPTAGTKVRPSRCRALPWLP